MTSPNITVENSERNIKVPSSLKFPVTVSAQSSCDVSITHLVTREQHALSHGRNLSVHTTTAVTAVGLNTHRNVYTQYH